MALEGWSEQVYAATEPHVWLDVHGVARNLGYECASGSGIQNALEQLTRQGYLLERPANPVVAAMGKQWKRRP